MKRVIIIGGGPAGLMAAVQAAKGSAYTLPECEYYIDGCVFDAWLVSGADGSDAAAYKAGDTVTVNGDMTAMAGWLFDEGGESVEAGSEEVEGGSETDETGETESGDESGLDVETEEVPEETIETEEPSEVGSVFSGAGIAAIVAAVILVLAAAAIAIARKKKK